MRHQWTVRRSTRKEPDGQHRWDHVYRQLLSWTTQQPTEEAHEKKWSCQPLSLEVNHESCSVRESLHLTLSADAEP
jgi:hypothetical protein